MAIQNLTLSNFRTYRDQSFGLGRLTVVIGPNGVGKTNLLESLWLLATTKSFRTQYELEAIHWGEATSHLQADDYQSILVRSPQPAKIFKIKGVVRRPLEYLGEFRAVLFTPEQVRIITGEPRERRRFLDTILAQRDRSLAETLVRYRQALSERNALLRRIQTGQAREDELDPWDETLAKLAQKIVIARRDLLDQLIKPAQQFFQAIAKERGTLGLSYRPSGPALDTDWLDHFRAERRREVTLGITTSGPHRDDVDLVLAGRPMAAYASRGEIRSAVLALKWAECQLLQDQDHQPLLLLDDFFSELDQTRRTGLAELVSAGQTVATTTDLEFLAKPIRDQAQIIQLA